MVRRASIMAQVACFHPASIVFFVASSLSLVFLTLSKKFQDLEYQNSVELRTSQSQKEPLPSISNLAFQVSMVCIQSRSNTPLFIHQNVENEVKLMVRRKVKIWTTESKKQRVKCRQILIVQLEHILSPFSARFWASRASEICASHSKASEDTTKDEKNLCGKWEGECFLMMYLRFVNQLSQDRVPRPGAPKAEVGLLECAVRLLALSNSSRTAKAIVGSSPELP